MVHGRWRKVAGCNPRRKISLGAIAVAINNKKFKAIRTHIGVSLKLWYLLYAITLFTDVVFLTTNSSLKVVYSQVGSMDYGYILAGPPPIVTTSFSDKMKSAPGFSITHPPAQLSLVSAQGCPHHVWGDRV